MDAKEKSPKPANAVSAAGQFVGDVRDKFADAFRGARGKVHHVIGHNNTILSFRIGENGRVVVEDTLRTINLNTHRRLKEAGEMIRDAGRNVPIKAQRQIRSAITGDPNKSLRQHMQETPQVKMMDKLSFTLGVVVIVFAEYLILRRPEWFALFYQVLMMTLMLVRFQMYMATKNHYFMLDFCYLINVSCMLHMAFFPDNLTWFKANFMLSMGPLLMAVVLWRNSLVFHSVDKMTSFFLHAFPPMMYHLYRWQLVPYMLVEFDEITLMEELFGPAIGLYIAWQLFYVFCTEVIWKDSLRSDPELTTSLRYLARDYSNPLNRLINQLARHFNWIGADEHLDPEQMSTKVVYMFTQLVYTLIVIMPAYFVYTNYTLSVLYLVAVFLKATWSGASYYIEIFSQRYNLKFEKPRSKTPSESEDSNKAEGINEEEKEEFVEALESLDLDYPEAIKLLDILQDLEDKQVQDTKDMSANEKD